ncbi:MAG: carbohydrate kinase family protein [Candidatus Methanomethylicia archaeon]
MDLTEIVKKIRAPDRKPDVTVMHDFFLDHFVTYIGNGGTFESYIKKINELAKFGGGEISETKQQILRGGKGFNASSALASLGAHVHYIGKTSKLGLYLMQFFAKGKDIDLTHVKTTGEMAMTVAIELKYSDRIVNLMFNYPGSVADFSFEDLEPEDLNVIRETEYLLLTQWSMNTRGTELAEKIFEIPKSGCRKFFDPGDPIKRKGEIKELIERVFIPKKFDVLGVNEGEAIWFASYFDEKYLDMVRQMRIEELGIECAKCLRDELNIRVDLHTPYFSASIGRDGEWFVPTFDVNVLRVTGAGDAWQAGNAYGELIGLEPEERLLLANATAAYYISNPKGEHGTLQEIKKFIISTKLRPLKIYRKS